ncbi:MAG: glycosyltransferase family 2 protein [Coriobacteriia bacterium]|nr:glycosyltransferase family 2 protein [Coriobacteriia bacterium]MCL2749670.1 glycosyltransferase family 2 protein [Coriobacteriia bacterium]
MTEPIISFAVPCYNVEEYLDNCVNSILAGCAEYLESIEIILVDDGSVKDNTPAKVDEWAALHPTIIRAVHQENGGHGQAVNTGLAESKGTYFKVVDADDWLGEEACKQVLAKLHQFAQSQAPIDLVIANYVYEKVFENKRTPIRYTSVLPQNKQFSWSSIGRFLPSQNILMHSVIYRTQLLKDTGLVLPQHTFYVDNIFVYVPLPHVKSIYYLNVDLYRYFIGREGQSVNEKTMISRIDQQLRITRIMIDAYDLAGDDVPEPKLRRYMENYLLMMMVICSVFLVMSEREDALEQRAAIWRYLHDRSPAMYNRMRKRFLGHAVNLNGRTGHYTIKSGYRLSQKVFKFN